MKVARRSAEIWLADVDAAGPALEAIEARLGLLARDERERHARIGSAEARRRWAGSRIVLRLVLARHADVATARAPFHVSPAGKPGLGAAGPQFSLSHSGGLVLVGLAQSGPVGIDLEICRDVEIAGRRRTAIEGAGRALVPGSPLPEDAQRRFLQAWTRLEALAKASGQGVGRLLETLGVRGTAPDRGDAARVGRALAEGARVLRVHDLDLGEGAVGAVAVREGAAPTVHRFPGSLEAIERFARGAVPRG